VRHERLPDVARIEIAPRRGLARPEAARYVGVSPGNFNAMVSDGRMPQPKRIGRRLVWDIRAIDVAFDELPDRDDSSSNADGTWDALPRDAYAGIGIDHQVLLVVPSLELIVVRFGGALGNPSPHGLGSAFWQDLEEHLFKPLMACFLESDSTAVANQ